MCFVKCASFSKCAGGISILTVWGHGEGVAIVRVGNLPIRMDFLLALYCFTLFLYFSFHVWWGAVWGVGGCYAVASELL